MPVSAIPGPPGALSIATEATDIVVIQDMVTRVLARRCQQFKFRSDEIVDTDDDAPAHTESEIP